VELRAQVGRNSSNSSKPPSTDPPWKPPGDRRVRGKRKRGGQPGHSKHERLLVEPDIVVPVRPAVCDDCGEGLTGDDPEPLRHQVAESPRVVAEVTEYQLHTLRCACCGTRTFAPLPDGVPIGAFGPRLQAIVAVCSGAYRLSKRNIEAIAQDFFGVSISLGSVSNLEQATSEALEQPFEEARLRVKDSRRAHADETSWREGKIRVWLWTAVTATAVVFLIRARRTAEVAKELLGRNFCGVLVTDQYNGYDWVPAVRRQICWAHLIRHFTGLLDHGEEAKNLGERLLLQTEALFSLWHRLRDQNDRDINRKRFKLEVEPITANFAALLREGTGASNKRVVSLCKGLIRDEVSLWAFVRHQSTEPTNNDAERVLRHAVIWRKTSYGTDSERGSRFVERMLTVVATLKLQGRDVLDYVTEACVARNHGRPAPALFLPGG
jgi:transposase